MPIWPERRPSRKPDSERGTNCDAFGAAQPVEQTDEFVQHGWGSETAKTAKFARLPLAEVTYDAVVRQIEPHIKRVLDSDSPLKMG